QTAPPPPTKAGQALGPAPEGQQADVVPPLPGMRSVGIGRPAMLDEQDRAVCQLVVDRRRVVEEEEVGIQIAEQVNLRLPPEQVQQEGWAARPVVLDRLAITLDCHERR